MSKLTPEQILKIREAKAQREAQREEARKRREAEAEQKKQAAAAAEEFIAKEFAVLPEPASLVAPIVPEPDVTATIIPDADIQKATDTTTLFREWLRTPEGLDASDPRLPNDAVRRGVFLEDALGKAFAAGYNSATI